MKLNQPPTLANSPSSLVEHAGSPDKERRPFAISIAGEINLDLILYGLPQEMPVEREIHGKRLYRNPGKFIGDPGT